MTVYYNDNEPFVCDWLENLIRAGLIPAGEVDRRPIQEVTPDDVRGFTQCHFFAGIGGWAYALQLAGWEGPVWTGSCPCQPFSIAGQRQGAADARHLWPVWFRLIRECRPPTVFGEQVATGDGPAWLDVVLAEMESVGYAVGAADLCAAGVGAPHIRPRLWFVADADAPRWSDAEGREGSPQSHRRPFTRAYDSDVLQHAASVRRLEQSETRQAGRGVDLWAHQPGISLVVDGVPGELDGILSHINAGLGNAIVPQVAAAFVRAYLDCGAGETVRP